jgi:N-acetylglutamate synthase-like GNAT family acetyltransferase
VSARTRSRTNGKSHRVLIRKAVMRDIGPILHLISSCAARGIMLARTEFELEAIRDFPSPP